MSSIDDGGENEFAYEESNVVGKSEDNPEEEDKKIQKAIKKEIEEEKDKKEDRELKIRCGILDLNTFFTNCTL